MFRELNVFSEGPTNDSDHPYGYYAMAEGKDLAGPMGEKHAKLIQAQLAEMNDILDKYRRKSCMNCKNYMWYLDEECIKLSCHVEMTDEKPCFEKK